MAEHEYESVAQLRGSASQATVGGPVRVRARQLHGDAPLLDDAPRRRPLHAVLTAARRPTGRHRSRPGAQRPA